MAVDLPDFLFFSCGNSEVHGQAGEARFPRLQVLDLPLHQPVSGLVNIAFLKLPLSFCFGLCRSLDVWNESRKVHEGLECLHVVL